MRSAIAGLLSLVLMSAGFVSRAADVGGVDWRSELEAEQGRNAKRVAAIDVEGAPIAKALRAVVAEIDRHNANSPDPTSVSAVNAYNTEADALDKRRDSLRAQAKTLVAERDRLTTRNREIQQRLHCVQLPLACSSGADCACSGVCGDLGTAGRGTMNVCQPR